MNDESNTDRWDACPPGELQKLAKRLRRQRVDRARAKVIGMVGAAIIVVLAGGIAFQQLFTTDSIACAEVQARIPQYISGRLDPQLTERIRVHLDQCPECGPPFRRMTSEVNLLGDGRTSSAFPCAN